MGKQTISVTGANENRSKGESMAFGIKSVEYYYITVEDQAGEGFKLLSVFAGVGVNLLAFEAVPLGPMRTQFTLFPDDGLPTIPINKTCNLH